MTRKSVTISTSGRKMKGTQKINATEGFNNLIYNINKYLYILYRIYSYIDYKF